MDINQLTGAHIKEIRNNLGITAEFVASKLGLVKSTYSSIENGKTNISLNQIVALAKVFNMTWTELLPITNNNQSFNGDYGINGNYNTNTNPTWNNFFANSEENIEALAKFLDTVLKNKSRSAG